MACIKNHKPLMMRQPTECHDALSRFGLDSIDPSVSLGQFVDLDEDDEDGACSWEEDETEEEEQDHEQHAMSWNNDMWPEVPTTPQNVTVVTSVDIGTRMAGSAPGLWEVLPHVASVQSIHSSHSDTSVSQSWEVVDDAIDGSVTRSASESEDLDLVGANIHRELSCRTFIDGDEDESWDECESTCSSIDMHMVTA